MKTVVKVEFRDIRDYGVVHKVGDVLDVDDERARALQSLGLVEGVDADEGKTGTNLFEPSQNAPQTAKTGRNKKATVSSDD